MKPNEKEIFISVDVETAGPIPGEYSMLSIGACLVDDPSRTFSCELKPISDKADAAALEVAGMSLDNLRRTGIEPAEAMTLFRDWVNEAADGGAPVMVGFNAPFDWSFVNYYFHRFAGVNPFGFTALDIKALWRGVADCSWSETRSSRIAESIHPELKGDHDALHDAQYQAELFRIILDKRGQFKERC